MSIGEFQLIDEFFRQEMGAEGVTLGIGDDCALLQVPEGESLAVSMDTLVGDVHFPANADPELIAERALRVNLSDLAAMGANPLWFTLGLTMPKAERHWLQGFSTGLLRAAHSYEISLVGGDTTRGPLSVTIQVHGSVNPSQALMRGNANPGDRVFVSGPLGDGAAALAVIRQQLDVGKSAFDYFMGRYYRPTPQIELGKILRGYASAALDVSDGLISDLGHICNQSVVGAKLYLEQLPLSEPVNKLVDRAKALDWALSGGDDYQLCFTVPPENVQPLQDKIKNKGLVMIEVGEIVSGGELQCYYRGKQVRVNAKGFQHFGPEAT
jgi:thiamine-monophosphate kinase